MIEIEKKYKISKERFAELYSVLDEHPLTKGSDYYSEVNRLFGMPDRQVLRLRTFNGEVKGEAVLTYKKPLESTDGFKRQLEIETPVGYNMYEILIFLGYKPHLVYEKDRTAWTYKDSIIALDKLPFGWYIELEGKEEDILELEKKLDLTDKVEKESYPSLTVAYGELEDGIYQATF